MESLYLVGVGVLALFAFVLAIIFFKFFTTWLRARVANAPVSIGKMIGMSLRKVPVGLIVDNRITAVKDGLAVRCVPTAIDSLVAPRRKRLSRASAKVS